MQQNTRTPKDGAGKLKRDDLGEVREGQADSSILHDKKDDDEELGVSIDRDISSTSQEEFIDDDANTAKESDS